MYRQDVCLQHLLTLKKLKCCGKPGKKRWFVLHGNKGGSVARLEVFDSEKQWLSNKPPKDQLLLSDCFTFSRTIEDVLPNHVAVYPVNAPCWFIGCCDEKQRKEWLDTILMLANDKDREFECCVDVNICKDTCLTADTGHADLCGPYRMCFTAFTLSLCHFGSRTQTVDIPHQYIESYGCQGQLFMLRLGRSSTRGKGELHMNVEDPHMARCIHKELDNMMREGRRHRSQSSIEPTKRPASGLSALERPRLSSDQNGSVSFRSHDVASSPVEPDCNPGSPTFMSNGRSPTNLHTQLSMDSFPDHDSAGGSSNYVCMSPSSLEQVPTGQEGSLGGHEKVECSRDSRSQSFGKQGIVPTSMMSQLFVSGSCSDRERAHSFSNHAGTSYVTRYATPLENSD